MNKNEIDLILFDLLKEDKKEEIENYFESRSKTMSQCTPELFRGLQMVERASLKNHEKIWNASLFINLSAHDLSVCLKDLIFEKNNWERKYYGRQLAVILYEFSEDIPTVLGKEFREAFVTLNLDSNLLEKLEITKKKVSVFWNNNRKVLKDIRTISGAHRDHDSKLILESIDRLDLMDLFDRGLEFGNFLNELGQKLSPIMMLAASTKDPIIET